VITGSVPLGLSGPRSSNGRECSVIRSLLHLSRQSGRAAMRTSSLDASYRALQGRYTTQRASGIILGVLDQVFVTGGASPYSEMTPYERLIVTSSHQPLLCKPSSSEWRANPTALIGAENETRHWPQTDAARCQSGRKGLGIRTVAKTYPGVGADIRLHQSREHGR
jgi:hypothetical protein